MKKLTYEEVKSRFEAEGCTLLSTEYLNSWSKLNYVCSCGNIADIAYNLFRRGDRCQKCRYLRMASKRKNEFSKVEKIFKDNGFVLISTEYKNCKEKLDCICSCGNKAKMSLDSVARGYKCKKCSTEKTVSFQRLSYDKVKFEFEKRGCILLSTTYNNSQQKLDYICSCGNISKISLSSLKHGSLCKKCGYKRAAKKIGEALTICGGLTKLNIPLYDTYAPQVDYCEEVKRDDEDERILNVKCTNCGQWFRPTKLAVESRIKSLNGSQAGECRLYCSDLCKTACPIFNRQTWPKGLNPNKLRIGQTEFREIVLERDNYTCQICGHHDPCGEFLVAHHVDPVACNPIESMDVDNGITLCQDCHQHAHNIPGCSTSELRAASY